MAQVGCTPDYTGCTYHPVTLQAGDSFVLPPGAEIILISDNTAITGQDGCLDLTTVEQTQCYLCKAIFGDKISDGRGSAWEGEQDYSYVGGISVNGVYYENHCPTGASGDVFLDGLVNLINTDPVLSGLLSCPSYSRDWDSDYGGYSTLCFKTTPSIASTIYMTSHTTLLGVDSPEPQVLLRDYARPLDSEPGRAGRCSCGC